MTSPRVRRVGVRFWVSRLTEWLRATESACTHDGHPPLCVRCALLYCRPL